MSSSSARVARLDQRCDAASRLAARGRLALAAPRLAAARRSAEARELERRDRGVDPGELLAELRGPLGRRRLERQRPQPLLHLGLEVARALDLRRDAGELELGAMAAKLEAAEARRLLDELAPLGRLGAEHRLDAALRDDGAQPAAEADVGEQLDQVDAGERRRG